MSKQGKRLIGSTLSRAVFTRFFITIVLFSISLIVLFFLAVVIASSFIWYDGPLYRFLNFLYERAPFVIIASLILGYVLIFLYYWKKTLSYIDYVMDACNLLVADNEEMIRLPAELVQIEAQMNQIKQSAMRNAHLVKEAEQRKNDLVVYLAHDLKTPLTSVIGYLTLLKDEREISEELKGKYLSISLEKALRLEELINDFFEITRFNLSHLTLEISQVNLTRMLEQVIFEFKPIFAEKNLQCTLHIETDMVITCDVDKMERVFDNLLRNAFNYSFENSTVEIEVTRNTQYVCLKFKNHGNTIPKEKLKRIFEQFFRLDTSRTSKTGGSGLGLAIAKEIVEQHKGKIVAYSEENIIEFTIFLPNSL